MDRQYLSLLFDSIDMQVYRKVTKDTNINGFRKGKAPKSVFLSFLMQTTDAFKNRLLTDIYQAYFPGNGIEDFVLSDEFEEEKMAGVMAACALIGQESAFLEVYKKTYSTEMQPTDLEHEGIHLPNESVSDKSTNDEELAELGTSNIPGSSETERSHDREQETDNDIESRSLQEELPQDGVSQSISKTVEGVRVMRYLGYISIKDSYRRPFYNYHPIAIINSDQSITRLDKDEIYARFPERGNIFVRSGRDESQIEEVFRQGKLYVLDLQDSMLEDNVKTDGGLNSTNKRVNLTALLESGSIHPASEIGLYPVIDESGVEDILGSRSAISISRDYGEDFYNEYVMLRDHDRLYGPFQIIEGADGSFIIQPQAKKRNYVFEVYFPTDSVINYYTGGDMTTYDRYAVTYVDIGTLRRTYQDFISNEDLLQELGRIIRAEMTDDEAEIELSEKAFLDLRIPSDILELRRKKVVELFGRQKSLQEMRKALSDIVKDLCGTTLFCHRKMCQSFIY